MIVKYDCEGRRVCARCGRVFDSAGLQAETETVLWGLVATRDHFIPKSEFVFRHEHRLPRKVVDNYTGKEYVPTNMVCVCRACNAGKDDNIVRNLWYTLLDEDELTSLQLAHLYCSFHSKLHTIIRRAYYVYYGKEDLTSRRYSFIDDYDVRYTCVLRERSC